MCLQSGHHEQHADAADEGRNGIVVVGADDHLQPAAGAGAPAHVHGAGHGQDEERDCDEEEKLGEEYLRRDGDGTGPLQLSKCTFE